MLEYEWGNPSAMMMAGEEPDQPHHHHHHGSDPADRPDMLGHYASSQAAFNDHINHHFLANPHHHHQHHDHHDHHDLSINNNNNDSSTFAHHHFNLPPTHHSHTQSQPPPLHHHHHLYDPRAYGGASAYAPQTPQSILSLEGPQFMLVPKSEAEAAAGAAGLCRPAAVDLIGSARIGLNLGGRTYFSSSEDDFMSRLYRRPRPLDAGGPAANSPRCQAEGCNADLSHAKHYHRRHKVCEFHSKASTVIAAGLTQRFCQQCSRFHLLSEFDNGKRSCRKRLADHNRRRRKTQQQQPNQENPKSSSSLPENSRANIPTSDHNVSRSPPDSGAQSSSSVTVAVSPPRMSLDCFRQRSTYQTTASSGSSSSLFFSSG